MKILHALPNLDPSAGGLPVVATRLGAAQAALGHEVGIACYRAAVAEARIAADIANVPSFDRVKLEYLAPLSLMECRLGLTTRRVIDGVVGRYDIVQIHGVWDTLARLTSVAARNKRRPYVITPHGMLDPWNLRRSRLKKQLALWLGYRQMLDNAAYVHALNRDEAELLAPLKLRPPIHVIPNAIQVEEYQALPDAAQFRSRWPALGDRPYVLFLGRLHEKKGLDYLADAFARVIANGADAALVLAGPDEGALRPFIERAVRLGLMDRVIVTGLIWGRQKLSALAGAACFCLPSRQEGFSMAILEALACRVPAVVSEACHFPEVADAGAGFVLPLESQRFAAAITELLNDPEKRHEMGRRGHDLVHERFTWPKVAQRTIEAYSRVVRLD